MHTDCAFEIKYVFIEFASITATRWNNNLFACYWLTFTTQGFDTPDECLHQG